MPLADLIKGTKLDGKSETVQMDKKSSRLSDEEREIIDDSMRDGTYMKSPNGKPTNLDRDKWVQVRTKSFKDWFGDWELGQKTINIVKTGIEHGFKNFEEARDWAKKNISMILSNDETNGKGNIRISNTAIDKFISESSITKSDSKDIHLAVLKILPDVIRESIDAEQHPDYMKGADGVRRYENGKNKDVTIHRLYGAVDIDGNIHRVKVTLKENVNDPNAPHKAYSFEATKIELLAGQHEEAADVSEPSSRNSNNSILIVNLLNGVDKSYEKGKKL